MTFLLMTQHERTVVDRNRLEEVISTNGKINEAILKALQENRNLLAQRIENLNTQILGLANGPFKKYSEAHENQMESVVKNIGEIISSNKSTNLQLKSVLDSQNSSFESLSNLLRDINGQVCNKIESVGHSINEHANVSMQEISSSVSAEIKKIEESLSKINSAQKETTEELSAVANTYNQSIQQVLNGLEECKNLVSQHIKGLSDQILEVINGPIKKNSESLSAQLNTLSEKLISKQNDFMEQFSSAMDDRNKYFVNMQDSLTEKSSILHNILSTIQTGQVEMSKQIAKFVEFYELTSESIANSLNEISQRSDGNIKQNKEMTDAVRELFKSGLDNITQGIEKQKVDIRTLIVGFGDIQKEISDKIQDLNSVYQQRTEDSLRSISHDFKDALEDSQDGFERIAKIINSNLNDIEESYSDLQVIQGDLVDNLNSMQEKLINYLDTLTNNIKVYNGLRKEDAQFIKKIENLCLSK